MSIFSELEHMEQEAYMEHMQLELRRRVKGLTKVCLSGGVVIFLCSVCINELSGSLDGDDGQDKLTV